MYSKTLSAMLSGLRADFISVEMQISAGIPCFLIVGLASKAIVEAKERVIAALKSSNFSIPAKRILVNLSPADQKKEGPQFDLAIASLILKNLDYIKVNDKFFENSCFLAELSLTGKLKGCRGILSLVMEASKRNIENIFISSESLDEISILKLDSKLTRKSKIYLIDSLTELVELMKNPKELAKKEFHNLSKHINNFNKDYQEQSSKKTMGKYRNLDSIKGQYQAKRALEIAITGKHNILFMGPPGCGKSMLAAAAQGIIPELSLEEAIELRRIRELTAKDTNESFDLQAPYRSPHNSCTAVSLIGGGVPILPGEVSLAHKGILFLDELTEFSRYNIDQLRTVLDQSKVNLNKSNQSIQFPADFILIAASNPCACGYLGDKKRPCICSPSQINRYRAKISGPILDRIDLIVNLSRLESQEILASSPEPSEEKLTQEDTNGNTNIGSNLKLKKKIIKSQNFARNVSKADQYKLTHDVQDLLKSAIDKFDLSARAYGKIIKVSRTIANIEASEEIKLEHLAEALQYRENFHSNLQEV
ncbi:MAG: YifB family Mg chelatase-like AAA ATPase [Candidatus Caenarcaniphilales bacterium]|nr:YifB family Mg chelatase-like AAA ATPase [Candidatus Caenarcaniphilales bacterium]